MKRVFLLAITGAAVVVIACSWLYTEQQRKAWQEVSDDLFAVARLRAEYVTDWRNALLSRATSLSERPLLRERLVEWLNRPAPAPDELLLQALRAAAKAEVFKNISVFDATGNLRSSTSDETTLSGETGHTLVAEVLRDQRAHISDIHREDNYNSPLIDVATPVFADVAGRSELAGVFLVCTALKDDLYSLFDYWPTSARSAESYLVRRANGKLEYISPVHLAGESVIPAPTDLDKTEVSAVRATEAEFSNFVCVQGMDYRGIACTTAAVPVPETSWYVVAEIDTREAFASSRRDSFLTLGLIAALIAVSVFGGLFILFYTKSRHYQNLSVANAETARMNRLYNMLSKTNEMIVHVQQRDELLQGVARIAVEQGQFQFAWIGVPQPDGKVIPVARAGRDYGYIDEIKATIDPNDPRGQGPTGRSLREGITIVINQFLQTGVTGPWHQKAHEAGVNAAAVFPIFQNGQVYATLNLYAAEADFFEERQIATIEEMARDVSFSLDNLKRTQERAVAVAELEALQERMSSYLAMSPVITYALRMSEDGLVADWVSENIAQVLGYSVEEALAKGWWLAHLDPNDRDSALAEMDNLFGVGMLRHEYRFLRKDGSSLWILDSAEVVRDPSGVVTGAVGAWVDITEQMQARLALEESEVRYRELFEHNPHPMYMHDRETFEFIAVNDAAVAKYGYSREEFLAMKLDAIRPPEDFPDVVKRVRASTTGFENMGIFRHRLRDGTIILAEITAHAFQSGNRLVQLVLAQDVTARVTVEKALKESEERLRLALSATGQGLWDLNLQSGQRLVSNDYEQMFGYAPDEMRETTFSAWQNLLHPDDLESTLKAQEDYIAGRHDTYRVEFRQRTKQGAWKWILSVGKIVGWDEQQRPLRMLGTDTDISAAKEAQELLRLRSASLEAAANSVVITDLSGGIVWANPAFFQLTGYTPQEALGRNPRDLVHSGKNRPEIYQDLWETITSGKTWRGEWINRRKDGSLYDEEVSITPVRDSHGTTTHFVAVKQDISTIKATQRALEASRSSYRRMIESLVVPVACSNASGEITFLNEQFTRIFGYTQEDIPNVETWFLRAYPDPAYRELASKNWDSVRRTDADKAVRNIHPYEYSVTCKNGEVRIVEIAGTETEEQLVVVFVDITEQKRAIALQLELLTAEAASKAKSSFLATMSHEIRTPMNGVIGALDVLRQTRLETDQSNLVSIIRDSAQALLTIINDILDFSKIEAGKMEIEKHPVCLEDLAESVCSALSSVAVEKSVDLFCFVDPALPDWVLSDSVRLRQILTNLVGNAIKFSAGHNRLPRVMVRMESAASDQFRMSVIDNGVGMPPETLQSLFRPFTQADGSITRRFGGTGLGLSICKSLTDMLNGSMAVESKLNEGSRFTVTLPFDLVEETPQIPEHPKLQGVHCLVLSDDQELAADWSAYVEAAGGIIDGRYRSLEALEENLPVVAPEEYVVLVNNLHARSDQERLLAVFSKRGLAATFLFVKKGLLRRTLREAENLYVLTGDIVRRAELLEVIALAAARSAPRAQGENDALPERIVEPSVEEARVQGRLILVAEDNEINQKVIRYQLAILGYACEIACNGKEALELLRRGDYGLLISDLHMPEMDGYTLATRIRQEERPGKRLPIIAFTANISRGQREHCLAAGMDDFLTKPAPMELFGELLEKWLPGKAVPVVHEAPAESVNKTTAELAILDTSLLAGLIGNDPALIAEFLGEYLGSLSKAAGEIKQAFSVGEWEKVGALAHRLKSSSRSVGAMLLGDCCERIERAGKAGDEASISLLMPEFERRADEVVNAIVEKRNTS